MVKKFIVEEFLKKKWKYYLLGISILVLSGVIQLIMPKMLGFIIDCLKFKSESPDRIFWLASQLLGMAILHFCIKFCWRYILMGSARDLECFVRAKLFAHLQTLPPKFYNNQKTGDLMAYATNDLSALRMAFSFGLVFFIDGILLNVASLFIMGKVIHPVLTAIVLVPITAAVIFIFCLRMPIRNKYLLVQEAYANLSDKIQENISGIRVVKAYVQEEPEIAKLNEASKHRVKVQMDYVRLSSLLSPMVQLCFGISFAASLIVGSSYVSNGVITLGDFIAFNTYVAMLTTPVTHIGKIVEVWQKAQASVKRLDAIFLTQTDIVDENPSFSSDRFKGRISIRNLNFTYPGTLRRTLKDINLDLEAGKTLGIIGKTGSGKTTLVNLLLRLYKIDKGLISIDGTDINNIPVSTLRDNIGYVPQDNFLFSATIKENIEFFKDVYSVDDVEEAARMSSVYENIADFPDGFDTVIGERGVTLSGGQKQRISIARAILKDPSIMILDDSLSAVDTKTEEEILQNLKNVLSNRTGIIIAHRISSLKHADEIIVLDKGRIIEKGTHEELLNRHGEYYKLYCAQLAESNIEKLEEATI